jgi:hypothetical protein
MRGQIMAGLIRNTNEDPITKFDRVHLSARRARKIDHEATISPRFKLDDFAWLDELLLSQNYRSRGDFIADGLAVFKGLTGEGIMPSWVKFAPPRNDER